jgi:hypothetical protein
MIQQLEAIEQGAGLQYLQWLSQARLALEVTTNSLTAANRSCQQ